MTAVEVDAIKGVQLRVDGIAALVRILSDHDGLGRDPTGALIHISTVLSDVAGDLDAIATPLPAVGGAA